MNDSKLSIDYLNNLRKDYDSNPENKMLERAVTQNGINNVARDPETKIRMNPVFSVEADTGKVSNQKQSGRCWMFALLNTLKHEFGKKYGVKDFEMSQNYLFFWDKIERANIFYDNIIATAGKPVDDRTVEFYLAGPGTDGGQWAMAVSLVQKYGVMPKSAFPESSVSENTGDLNTVLNYKLRQDAMKLRNMVNDDVNDEDIKAARSQMLSEVYRITAYSLGVPRETFDFEYRDDKKKYHIDRDLTPKSFFDKYFADIDLDDYVVLSNSPDKDYEKVYSMSAQDNVVGGRNIEFLNLPMEDLKKASIAQLKDGQAVWISNDIAQQSERKAGYLDSNLYRYADLFNIDLSMSKKDRFEYHDAEVSHATALTGVDLVDDKPRRWKMENSWGAKNGFDGYYTMDDSWMNDYVYEVVVNKKYLSDKQKALLNQAPIELKPWDSLE
ncbi:C1 family peptidase [Apilactobacillus timberlakei]|uniref:Aminopeptidase n=1 Tax=Apilactobacillus timberlakei TaxID=2008380 RepID=A0ABY2YY38_9LACO|nr:C1 family peptidase [Apilactobacillus timberlakei]TPR13276.1 aminopeptidase [Apilactobacillus timberlakei]TPR14321.1 aminopeptidase [Apilactobacillus timberlakei]TPR16574.1 aminopeptidase [Apilactobacillus timberlakei]